MRRIVVILTLVIAIAACKGGEKKTSSTTGEKTGTETTGTAARSEPTTTGIDVGSAMPEYTATNVDGSPFDLATRRDKIVVLNLWATWCSPCRFEIPELQRIHDAYAARGFEVIGVSVDEGDVDSVKSFITDHKMTYPQVLDPQGKLANILETSVLPTTVILDRNGKILWKKFGQIEANDAELKSVIEKAL
jgi:peroxiredoxin